MPDSKNWNINQVFKQEDPRKKEVGADLVLYGIDTTYIDCQIDTSGPNFNGLQKVEQNT